MSLLGCIKSITDFTSAWQIVFSACYLSLSLLSLVTGPNDYRHIAPAKRSAGYYGNSHIFRGGDNLGDPHSTGDEHHHYIGRAAAARGVEARKRAYQVAIQQAQPIIHIPDEGEPHVDNIAGAAIAEADVRRAKSATLAEQARIQQLQAEQRIIERVRRVDDEGAVPTSDGEQHAAGAGKQKRPKMPFDKLAKAKKPAAAPAIALPPRKKELPSTPELDTVDSAVAGAEQTAQSGASEAGEVVEETAVGSAQEAELTDREQIAELRKRAATRRQAKKAAAAAAAAAEQAKPSEEEGLDGVGAGAGSPAAPKVERPAAKLGLVAKRRRAQMQGGEQADATKVLEVAAILSDPM